jgi:hypothetical protein
MLVLYLRKFVQNGCIISGAHWHLPAATTTTTTTAAAAAAAAAAAVVLLAFV